MSPGPLEKLVLVLTVISVLCVGATVGLLSMVSLESGMRGSFGDVVEQSALATGGWIEAERARVNGWAAPGAETPMIVAASPAPRPGPGGDAAGEGAPPPARKDYYVPQEKAGEVSQAETIEGYSWLRKVPGVAYARPKAVDRILYQKYSSFKDSMELAQEGGGKFTTTKSGDPAYEITWMDEQSLLATRIGLRPGDKVISINGQPVGNSPAAGKALYDQLKGESRFAVLVERGGQQVVLSYYVR